MSEKTATLTMQAIADLAQVKRPVVSVWRNRYADSDQPFPAPVQEDPLRFDAHAVAEWLAETGRGNNEHVVIENPLHADLRTRLFADPETTSALLLLAELLGEPLGDFFPDELVREYVEEDLPVPADEILSRHALDDAIDVGDLAGVDAVAEAAFSAQRALDLLIDSFTDRDAAWASEALTQQAQTLLGTVCAELYRDAPTRRVVPDGVGGMVLVDAMLPHLNEQDRPVFSYPEGALDTSEGRAAWRRLRARQFSTSPYVEGDAGLPFELPVPVLHLAAWQTPSTPEEFLAWVEDKVITLAPGDCMVVVGPSATMIDSPARHARAQSVLRPRGGYLAPLRYCTDLPKGMSRFGGRRRLALWVFAEPLTAPEEDRKPVTVVGTHAGRRPDTTFVSDLAADVATATGGWKVIQAHKFRTSIPLSTERFLFQDELTTPVAEQTVIDGGDLLASYWELNGESTTGLRLLAGTPRPRKVLFTEATKARAKDIPGNRVPAESLSSPAPGAVTVLGAQEIRNPGLPRHRAIDRLLLENVAHQAQFTEPGDVIYVATGGTPAAIVDHRGGHVVEAPARLFRCLPPKRGTVLVPEVVAADIAADDRRDRKSWQLRLVPTGQLTAVTQATAKIRRRRDELYAELSRITDLETTLLDGLASGALHEDHDTTDTDDSKDTL
ncbi:MAG: hypothetical protein L0K27_03310 [Corynebacterium nuruki]|nr:hypothetical protein [Corynebacterium nuruki]